MPLPKIITKYDYDNHVHPDIKFTSKDKSLTNQADMEAADINKIMARYQKTGVLVDDFGVQRQPTFGDFSELHDYHEMLIAVRNAERVFGTLPAATRNFFKNDPQELINFLDNPENDDKAVELGLKQRVDKPIVKQPAPGDPGYTPPVAVPPVAGATAPLTP